MWFIKNFLKRNLWADPTSHLQQVVREGWMSRITPFLWFDGQAREAAGFYVSIFKNARILETTHYLDGMPQPPGSILTVRFQLDGQEFVALNGGPADPMSSAISFLVGCETQEEIDRYWSRLSEGGQEQPGGWVRDRFGVTWQVVPAALSAMFSAANEDAAKRGVDAMLRMKKLDLAALERAIKGS